jgi:adenylate kinase
MRLVLIGPPGSGKGTQAELLVARLGLMYIGTGAILRNAIAGRTDIGQAVGPLLERGALAPDDIVYEIMAQRLADRPESFVLDGYPRTYRQALLLNSLLRFQLLKLDAVFHLTISDEDAVCRITDRRSCANPNCGSCFHLALRPPKRAMICDACGDALIVRDDDTEATARRRLLEFHKNTDRLFEYYRDAGVLIEVPAMEPVETIYANIAKALRR